MRLDMPIQVLIDRTMREVGLLDRHRLMCISLIIFCVW